MIRESVGHYDHSCSECGWSTPEHARGAVCPACGGLNYWVGHMRDVWFQAATLRMVRLGVSLPGRDAPSRGLGSRVFAVAYFSLRRRA